VADRRLTPVDSEADARAERWLERLLTQGERSNCEVERASSRRDARSDTKARSERNQ
jgi:hypothetical protein